MTRITHERLIAFAAGDLQGSEADEVAAHLATNPDAARTVELYRFTADAAGGDDTIAAPADLVARAKAIFRAETPARRGLAEQVRDVLAHLVYDSRLHPAPTRATADLVQLAFEAGDVEIDLRAEPRTAGVSGRSDATWRVVGQVLAEDAIGTVAVTVVGAGADVVAEVRSDDRALFRLDLPIGTYDLRIAIGDDTIVLNDVRIG